MAAKRISPEFILPTRMTLRVPAETTLRFSVLNFPYQKAFDAFIWRFKAVYLHQHPTEKKLPYKLWPSFRQLNDALMALAPGLIQGFETVWDGEESARRMVAFTHFEDGSAEDFPTLTQLRNLTRHWLEAWAEQPELETIVRGDGKEAWQSLMQAFDGEPETEWQHDVSTPAELAADPASKSALGYVALPALLSALLHGKSMVIQSGVADYPITWRRAHDGGTKGLHLVSQPMPSNEDYFAYRLDFSVQNQAGYFDSPGKLRSWIFARVSIQRYISERDRTGNETRATSILVGCNHNRFFRTWDANTTLIRLPVARKHGKTTWQSGVGKLLDKVGMRKLALPEEVLAVPERYASYGHEVDGDEYYVVYAEGRKFGEARGRGHKVKTGVSLRERSQIIEGVLSLLGGWLEASPLLRRDVQAPTNVLALRDYKFMFPQNKSAPKKWASWREMLKTSLTNGGHSHLHLVVLYRSPEFCQRAQAQIDEALMDADKGDTPLVTVSDAPLPPLLYAPLAPGDLDPQKWPRDKRGKKQIRQSYEVKREEWRGFLRGLDWMPGARRLVLIDSNGENDVKPHDLKIKGAVRDACHREGVLSQFIIGHTLKADKRVGHEGKLKRESAGRLKNAVLDLVVRQQGILYAPPRDIYRKAAGLDAATADQLDVIAFCRVEGTTPSRYRYVLAVRLRANGEVDVLLPNDPTQWLSYDLAAHKFAMLISQQRVRVANENASPTRIDHSQMLDFVHEVLTKRLERPTLAVIEAVGWRNGRGADEEKYCWTQLRNGDLSRVNDRLHFDARRSDYRDAPALDQLLGVVRLRANDETPQYVTAADWSDEALMRDIPHLTGYVDPCPTELFTYMSVARLPEMQKKQTAPNVTEAFRADVRDKPKYEDIAVKHAQLIEMVPFFVHPRFQSEDGLRQLSRCIHFLRISPAFTMGDIALPYPMHLGETLIDDQLVMIGAED